MIKHKIALTVVTLMLLPAAAEAAHAETLSITGNGTASSSDINTSSNNTTTINQNNTTDTTNDIAVDANTGDNSADENTGDTTAIDTGDVAVDTTVMNTGNTNVAKSDDCCIIGDKSAVISGNGAGSDNEINHTSSNTTVVHSSNNASITNITRGTANTGGNTADGNNGDVSIRTGNTSVREEIHNHVNENYVKVVRDKNGKIVLKITGNGADSRNLINFDEDNDTFIDVHNEANILNRSIWDLITGNNSANNNNEDVRIVTGDIDLDLMIKNVANKNVVEVVCDCPEEKEEVVKPEDEEKEKPQQPVEEQKEQPITMVREEKPTQARPGQVLGAHMEAVLPITGNPWVVLAILGNAIMMFFGMLLRLRSGRSPSTNLAI